MSSTIMIADEKIYTVMVELIFQRAEIPTVTRCSLLAAVSRFIKYTGYGNAAGLLAARGLLRGGRDSGIYSEDEESDTEEYREAKAQSVPPHSLSDCTFIQRYVV